MVRGRYAVILLSIFVLIAGCTGGGPAEAQVDSPSPTPSPLPTGTATQSPTAPTTPTTSSSTPNPRGPAQGTEWTVTITRVIDGDTVEARFPNGEIDTLRLLGVDTPETTLSRVSPEEFEGIPDTTAGRDHLFNWGERATDFTQEKLDGKTVQIAIDPEADRRGSFGRLLVYIYVEGGNFNELLLIKGYARMYDSSFSKRNEFDAAEASAQANNVGLWNFESTPTMTSEESSSTSQLVVADIHPDAAGNDHDNLNDEYIEFKNTGDQSLDLTDWTVADEVDHTYRFPTGFTLDPGATVTLYTGSGDDTASELYWGSGSAIWNNGGDTIIVKDDTGNIVFKHEY